MKINAVVGNPPYTRGLYKVFMWFADKISDTCVSMVVLGDFGGVKEEVIERIKK